MIGLSRQFREKNENDYIEININVTSPPTTYNCAFTPALTNYGGAKSYDFYHGTFEIDWGDGSDTQNIDDSPFLGHSYGVTGSYTIRVYGRDPINSFSGWEFSQPSGVDWGTLDFSNYNYMNKFYLPSTATASIIMPTQYLASPSGNSTSLNFHWSSGSITIQGITDSTFDTTQWGGFNSIYSQATSANFDRIKLNDSNADTRGQFLYSVPLVAVGPSASDPNNWDADFQGQNLWTQFRIKGTGITGATGNIQNIYFGTTSFATGYGRDFTITETAILDLNLAGISWWNLANHWVNATNNPNLQTITMKDDDTIFAGDFYQLAFNDNDITGHLDLSGIPLNPTQQSTLTAHNNPNLTEVTAPTGSPTKIGAIYYYSCAITTINGFDVILGTQAGNVNNAKWRFENNLLDAVQVNKFLVDADNASDSGFTGRLVNLGGSGNSAPDGTSGGYDGDAAKQSLLGKGWTVTTN